MKENRELELNRSHIFIIAEIGVNHNGSLELAKKLVNAAKNAGADAVKFQSFKTEKIVSLNTKKANYQHRSQENTQYEMLKNLELSFDEFRKLKLYCDEKNIEFIITPYDNDSIEFFDNIGVEKFKIASADLINKELVENVAKTGKSIILSLGMANLGEIERTVEFINRLGNDNLILMHCTTAYPTPYDQVNMNFVHTLKDAFGLPVGYSDHTLGTEIPIMAASFGAKYIEKHFTLDKKMSGPDHFASSEPAEFRDMVKSIRHIENAFGDGKKVMTDEEKNNVSFMRRSIHASRNISKGHIIEKDDFKIIRPFEGINPWFLDKIIGRKIKYDIKENDPIKWQDLD